MIQHRDGSGGFISVFCGNQPYLSVFSAECIRKIDLADILDGMGGDGPHVNFYGIDPEQENHEYIKQMEAASMITVFSQDLGAAPGITIPLWGIRAIFQKPVEVVRLHRARN